MSAVTQFDSVIQKRVRLLTHRKKGKTLQMSEMWWSGADLRVGSKCHVLHANSLQSTVV